MSVSGSFDGATCPEASHRPLVTAVRLEGVIEAYRFARYIGDEERIKRYQEASMAAMRQVLQGVVDEENVFYFPDKDTSLGALRYDTRHAMVRIDAPAHAMIAFDYALRHLWPPLLNMEAEEERSEFKSD